MKGYDLTETDENPLIKSQLNKFLSGFDDSQNKNEEQKKEAIGQKAKAPEPAASYSYTASVMGGLSSIYKWTRGETNPSSKERQKEKDLNIIDD